MRVQSVDIFVDYFDEITLTLSPLSPCTLQSSAHETRVPQEPGLSGGDGDSTYKKVLHSICTGKLVHVHVYVYILCYLIYMYMYTCMQLYDETKDELAKEREERVSLVDKMSKLESQLKEKGQTIGEFMVV